MGELFDSLRTSVQYLVSFCSRPKTDSDIISGRFMGPVVLEVVSDALFGVAVDNVGMGVPVKFGHSRSNGFVSEERRFSISFVAILSATVAELFAICRLDLFYVLVYSTKLHP